MICTKNLIKRYPTKTNKAVLLQKRNLFDHLVKMTGMRAKM